MNESDERNDFERWMRVWSYKRADLDAVRAIVAENPAEGVREFFGLRFTPQGDKRMSYREIREHTGWTQYRVKRWERRMFVTLARRRKEWETVTRDILEGMPR